jgi:hypothetical protein
MAARAEKDVIVFFMYLICFLMINLGAKVNKIIGLTKSQPDYFID